MDVVDLGDRFMKGLVHTFVLRTNFVQLLQITICSVLSFISAIAFVRSYVCFD